VALEYRDLVAQNQNLGILATSDRASKVGKPSMRSNAR
jgi:hypothetical protein